MSGAAIVNGSAYWGSGYYFGNCLPGAPGCGINNKLYAFSLPSEAGDR